MDLATSKQNQPQRLENMAEDNRNSIYPTKHINIKTKPRPRNSSHTRPITIYGTPTLHIPFFTPVKQKLTNGINILKSSPPSQISLTQQPSKVTEELESDDTQTYNPSPLSPL